MTSPPPSPPAAWQHTRLSRLAGPVGCAALLVATIAVLSSLGPADQGPASSVRLARISSCAWLLISTGPIVIGYLLGAAGLGRLAIWGSWKTSPFRHSAQLGIGLALMLTLSHLLGVLGLLSGDGAMPRITAWAAVAIGLALLADQIVRGSLRPERWPVFSPALMLGAPVVGLLLVAACNPPGWQWASEFGAYDALSYHLQLPKEWAAGQRLWPAHHNVYSFLPSYMEAAYLHLAQLMPGSQRVIDRLLADDGEWIIACQLLHACVGAIAVALVARACLALLTITGLTLRTPAIMLSAMAGVLLLSTPWTIVVSSLAYNEAAVLALGAAGCLVALDPAASARARGLLCGVLVGAAASAKPTALLILGPTVALVLLARIPIKQWAMPVLLGATAGTLVMLPWLVRNWLDAGNPVFPFAAKLFGSGHWTGEQVERYARNHHFAGTIVERVSRLFSTTFGIAHEQFAAVPLLTLVAAVLAIVARRTRTLALTLLGGIVAGALGWMAFTHLQSRFLVPLLVPMTLLAALGLASVSCLASRAKATSGDEQDNCASGACSTRTTALSAVALITSLASVAMSVASFLNDARGGPNTLLAAGPGSLTGMVFESQLKDLPETERNKAFRMPALNSPIPTVNLALSPQDRDDVVVYLLGDGAPLYYLGATGLPTDHHARTGGVLYHTTWDRSPMGDAMDTDPESHAAWSAYLRKLGVTHVLINLDELARLAERDHYYDPRVSLAKVRQWVSDPVSGLVSMREWPRKDAQGRVVGGQFLYRLEDPQVPVKDRTP